jgi:hypothetical protein
MIVPCARGCGVYFDDEFRTTICPHQTFAANNGLNAFAHHPESYRSTEPPSTDAIDPSAQRPGTPTPRDEDVS